MDLSWLRRITPRHVVAVLLGGALVVMPLLILSYDPESKLERLRTPLCQGGLDVVVKDERGESSFDPPDAGLHMWATVDGAPYPVEFLIFQRLPGEDWEYRWRLKAEEGKAIYYLNDVRPGFAAYARAIDPTGERCPTDSVILRA